MAPVGQRQPKWVPNTYLENPDEFGSVARAAHITPRDLTEAGELIASLAQHRAALVIRSHRDRGLTVRRLAELLGTDEGYLSGMLTGRYPADFDDLARWALVLDDPSILPVFDDFDGLRPS